MTLEQKLYRGTVNTLNEGPYSCAIRSAPALADLVRPYMSYGKDERDVDKHNWKLPIPPAREAE